MSRRRTPLPTTVADCHKLILDLHADLAQLEVHTARLGDEIAARHKRSVASKRVPRTDRADRSVSFHAVFPNESD